MKTAKLIVQVIVYSAIAFIFTLCILAVVLGIVSIKNGVMITPDKMPLPFLFSFIFALVFIITGIAKCREQKIKNSNVIPANQDYKAGENLANCFLRELPNPYDSLKYAERFIKDDFYKGYTDAIKKQIKKAEEH